MGFMEGGPFPQKRGKIRSGGKVRGVPGLDSPGDQIQSNDSSEEFVQKRWILMIIQPTESRERVYVRGRGKKRLASRKKKKPTRGGGVICE